MKFVWRGFILILFAHASVISQRRKQTERKRRIKIADLYLKGILKCWPHGRRSVTRSDTHDITIDRKGIVTWHYYNWKLLWSAFAIKWGVFDTHDVWEFVQLIDCHYTGGSLVVFFSFSVDGLTPCNLLMATCLNAVTYFQAISNIETTTYFTEM